jgi:hypothetical protein
VEFVQKILVPFILPISGFIVALGAAAFAIFKGRCDQVVGVKPALVFVYDPTAGWQVQNIGSGPAMNIVLAQAGRADDYKHWTSPIRIPPLKKDGLFGMHWDPKIRVIV